jgi:deoxyribodipyrimidine photolyase
VTLGRTYPRPMLDHGAARLAALARLKQAQA